MGQCSLKELIEYKTLNQIMWKEEDLFYIAHTLIKAVILLHSHNIYHSDLKPENIVLDYDSQNYSI